MTNHKVRTYKDVKGRQRRILFKGLGYFVKWHKDLPPSDSGRWALEDGSVVQIPNNLWSHFNIDYKDEDK